MNKILIFSDIHIHKHKNSSDRLKDCLQALLWVFNTAKQRGIQNIVFAGDLFQDRQKIHTISYVKTFEIFEKYKDINVYLLLGNHDLWFHARWDVNNLIPFRSLPNLTMIDKPCTVNIAGKPIDFIPYTHDPKSIIVNNFKNKSDILFFHGAINGATLNTLYGTTSEVSVEHDGEMEFVDVNIFDGWRRVFLGHYHGEQKLNNHVEYIGSPLQLNFSEAFQKKHIISLNLDNLQSEYIENTFSPKHLILKESELQDHDLTGNFVQVFVENINDSSIIELKNKVESSGVNIIEFKEEKSKLDTNSHDMEEIKQIMVSEGNILDKFIKLKKPELDLDKLMNIGKKIISSSIEQVECEI